MCHCYESNEENINFLEELEPGEESTSDEIPKEQRKLRTQPYDKSVSDLINMIRMDSIILNVEYQRNYIWDNKKSSLLIESILLNIPIPVIYASEEEAGEWNIVDGLQRLTALKKFVENNFKLMGLEILQELNGLKYDELNQKAKRILNNFNLRIILIFNDSHPEIKYDIFMRLNTGSVRLKEQELRNCLYRGAFNELLKELRTNKTFLNILGLKEPHKRMDDMELILRYFAFSENFNRKTGDLLTYRGKIKSFLNIYMEKNKDIGKDKSLELKKKFDSNIEKISAIFGQKAFRRRNLDGSYDNPINRSLMDVIMLSFESFDLKLLMHKKEKIIDLYTQLPLQDDNFEASITLGTSEPRRINYRLATWINNMEQLMSSGD